MTRWCAAVLVVAAWGCGPMPEPETPQASDFDLPPLPAETTTTDDVPVAAPRLRHTKTLGVSEGPDRTSQASQASAAGAASPTVIIYNNIQQSTSVWGGGYGGYVGPGYGAGAPTPYAPSYGGVYGGGASGVVGGARGPGSGGSSAPPPVGGDWPRVPSYGPR